MVENAVVKTEIAFMSNFSFSHTVFKRIKLHIRKNKGLFGKWLTYLLKGPTKVTLSSLPRLTTVVALWLEHLPCEREVMGFIPCSYRSKSLKLVEVAFLQDYGNSTTTGLPVSG